MPQKRTTAPKTALRTPRPHRPGSRDLERLFTGRGFADFRWIDPAEIVTAEWVRMKCRFGCREYGRNAACPPNTPPVEACARFFREYKRAVVFRFAKTVDKPEDRHPWSRKLNLQLLEVEAEVFKAGFVKAFLLPMDSCNYCLDCAGVRAACKQLKLSRPSPDAMAVDVYATVRKIGYPIRVLAEYDEEMNRYAFLLVD